MTTFRNLMLLILSVFPISSFSSNPKSLETLLRENHNELELLGSFTEFDSTFYYLGIKSLKENSSDSEFEFLMGFQEGVSEILSALCKKSGSSLRPSYRYQIPFSKNVIPDSDGKTFIAILTAQAVDRETPTACEPHP